ncbi:MAG: DUF3179 domain-containing protein, partial [Alkalispirochaeta sp.]
MLKRRIECRVDRTSVPIPLRTFVVIVAVLTAALIATTGSGTALYAGGQGERAEPDAGGAPDNAETSGRSIPESSDTADPASTRQPATPPVPREELPTEYLDQNAPGVAGAEFITDFSRATVPYSDILSGGPPKDGIPSIDEPRFVSLRDAREWLSPREPVIVVSIGGAGGRTDGNDSGDGKSTGETRIYPLQILTWHEIVNDTVGGTPVTVTYCPLCNTGVAFERDLDGHLLDFGTTGRLRFSNLVMYDRQTESWWQQASGDGIAGFYAGSQLTFVPTTMLPFSLAADSYPEATVLSRETGYTRGYGRNPYVGYDTSDRPFLYRGPDTGDTFQPLERVVSIEHNGDTGFVPYSVLPEDGHASLAVGGTSFIVLWEGGTASALDSASIADGRDVGTANVFFQETRTGREVRFTGSSPRSSDDGTRWNVAGRAVEGPLSGEVLRAAAGVQHFWFSHAALVE